MKSKKNLIVFFALVFVLFLLDMLSKRFTDGNQVDLIPKFLSFNSVHNTGIAFGMFGGLRFIFIIINSILTVAAVVAWWFYGRKYMAMNIGFAFFICGAIGNLYDRIVYGYVRDFISFSFFSTIFNVADICLTVGTIMLVIISIVTSFKHLEKKDAA